MNPNLAELVSALPDDLTPPAEARADQSMESLLKTLAKRPVPIGRWSRFWTMGTLKGKIAGAYIMWWARTFVSSADVKKKKLSETHLRSALRLLNGMSYLRGAIMKLGQVLSTYPNVVPEEFADLLGRLHFEAPPMHFSLLREHVRNELGADPEELFETFETEAFAAASLGQVHRATLKGTGQQVAVKIQYPNIARTIHDDFRNMYLIMKPMRLSEDWDNILDQVQGIQRMLELETDYEQEAENLRLGRKAFRESDRIFVPKPFPELSSKRVLTMEYVVGVHLPEYLASRPSQDERNQFGNLMALSALRLSYTAEMCYADPQPGNYLFMPDGRLGLIDFGCIHHFTRQDIEYLNETERAFLGTGKDVRDVMVRVGDGLSDRQQQDEARMKLMIGWADWVWEPLFMDGPFDFADETYFQRGMDMYCELVRKRYTRSLPLNTWLARNFMGLRALLTRMKAVVNMSDIYRRESTITRNQ